MLLLKRKHPSWSGSTRIQNPSHQTHHIDISNTCAKTATRMPEPKALGAMEGLAWSLVWHATSPLGQSQAAPVAAEVCIHREVGFLVILLVTRDYFQVNPMNPLHKHQTPLKEKYHPQKRQSLMDRSQPLANKEMEASVEGVVAGET